MDQFDGASYQARFDALEAQGADLHGEARLVLSFNPGSVLDAGCGTGRVAIELVRHGIEVVGVDVSASMLAEARALEPAIEWYERDLAHLDLGRVFDLVVLAGNVPIFCRPGDRKDLVRSCARHVAPHGRMIAGFQLDRGYSLDEFDRASDAEGFVVEHRYATWDREPFDATSRYCVSIMCRHDAHIAS